MSPDQLENDQRRRRVYPASLARTLNEVGESFFKFGEALAEIEARLENHDELAILSVTKLRPQMESFREILDRREVP